MVIECIKSVRMPHVNKRLEDHWRRFLYKSFDPDQLRRMKNIVNNLQNAIFGATVNHLGDVSSEHVGQRLFLVS